MRRLTEGDLARIMRSTIEGYHIEAARVKKGPFTDSDHYGIILGRNLKGHYVTWQFHLLDDDSVSVYWGHYHMEDRDAAIHDYNTRDLDAPRRFTVAITEMLVRTVEVEANDQHEAEQIVSDGWHDGKYTLDAEDFIGVDFEAVPVDAVDGAEQVSQKRTLMKLA